MKIKIKNWDYAKKAQRYVRLSIKKFRFVKDRESYLKSKGFEVKVTQLRDYSGLGKHEDYLFKKKGMVERRIIVGRPYATHNKDLPWWYNERDYRTGMCVVLKAKADEIDFKIVTK